MAVGKGWQQRGALAKPPAPSSSCRVTTEGSLAFPWQGGRQTSWADDNGNGWVVADILLPESVWGHPRFSSFSRSPLGSGDTGIFFLSYTPL